MQRQFQAGSLAASWLQVLYEFLQGVVILMLIIHGIQYINFQPRLALISKTLAAMIPDMGHFIIV
jgi:hypothetical protein